MNELAHLSLTQLREAVDVLAAYGERPSGPVTVVVSDGAGTATPPEPTLHGGPTAQSGAMRQVRFEPSDGAYMFHGQCHIDGHELRFDRTSNDVHVLARAAVVRSLHGARGASFVVVRSVEVVDTRDTSYAIVANVAVRIET